MRCASWEVSPAFFVRTAYRGGTAWQRELKKPGYIIRNADDTEALTRMKAIDRFQETMPGYPGKASEQMWENFIMRGELARGVLRFDDVTVDLSKVAVSVQLFGSHRDAIVSWAAAHHGVDLFTGSPRVEFTTVETSHLGLIAGVGSRGTDLAADRRVPRRSGLTLRYARELATQGGACGAHKSCRD